MGASEKASVAFGKASRRIIFTFCNLQKQSCCKAKMLPGYTSLFKKVKQFSKRFDWNNIFTAILTEASGKASVTLGKASRRMIFTICNLL